VFVPSKAKPNCSPIVPAFTGVEDSIEPSGIKYKWRRWGDVKCPCDRCTRLRGEPVIINDKYEYEYEWDSMLLEDNGTYKCIPGSGPQHYVGQVLKYRNKRKSIICTKVSDSHSLWKEVNEHTLEVKPKPKIMNKVDIDKIVKLLKA